MPKPKLQLRCGNNDKYTVVDAWLQRSHFDKAELKRKKSGIPEKIKGEERKEKKAKLRDGRKQELGNALIDFGFGCTEGTQLSG